MIIVTTENIANYNVTEVLGPVFGLTVRARGLGKDIVASLKGLVGGEINQYTEMLEDARKQAIEWIDKVKDEEGNNINIVNKLFDEIAPKYKDRKGGYTRIYKTGPRRGDAAPMAILELV